MKEIIKNQPIQTFHCYECGCDFRSDEYIRDEDNISCLSILRDICPKCDESVYKFYDEDEE